MKWQPMETAPKGERILMRMKHGVIEGTWDGETGSGYYWRPMEWYPSHWMPLPSDSGDGVPDATQLLREMLEEFEDHPTHGTAMWVDRIRAALDGVAVVDEAHELTVRYARLGTHVENFALTLGWKREDGEGAFEFIQRKSYRQGWEDGKLEGSGDIHRDGVKGLDQC